MMATLPLARLTDVTAATAKPGRVPWRITSDSRCSYVTIVDADDNAMVVCAPEIAGRIVASVNMVECAHGRDRDRRREDEQS